MGMQYRKKQIPLHRDAPAQIQNQNAESDPVFLAHPAYNLTSADVTDVKNLSGTNTGDQDLSGYALGVSSSVAGQTAEFADANGKQLQGGDNFKAITSDVSNDTTSNTDVTGLSFSVVSGAMYWFRAVMAMTGDASTTGAGVACNGPATSFLSYHMTVTSGNGGGTSLATRADCAWDYSWYSSTLGTHGVGIVEGFVVPSANGTVIMRFRSEVAGNTVTVKAGSFLRWRKLT
jgi:hypothetical protein